MTVRSYLLPRRERSIVLVLGDGGSGAEVAERDVPEPSAWQIMLCLMMRRQLIQETRVCIVEDDVAGINRLICLEVDAIPLKRRGYTDLRMSWRAIFDWSYISQQWSAAPRYAHAGISASQCAHAAESGHSFPDWMASSYPFTGVPALTGCIHQSE